VETGLDRVPNYSRAVKRCVCDLEKPDGELDSANPGLPEVESDAVDPDAIVWKMCVRGTC
jgi:hypothetical protein